MSELKFWVDMAKSGQISRREFFGRAVMLGTSAALASTMLGSKSVFAAEPKKGGSVKFGLSDGSQTDSLDPATWPGSFAQVAFAGAMCNCLTEITPDGDIVADLAESFEASEGATKWAFKLRPGLKFHDGKPVTTADVIASFRYHMTPDTKSSAKALLKIVADITAEGADTVVFKLSSGSGDFPYVVADFHLSIMPAKADGTLDWSRGVGTGAFTLVNFEPGRSAKLKRNPNYHKPGKPYFDEVEMLVISDVTARTNALITGQIDFMDDCDRKTLSLLERNPTIDILRIPATRHFNFDMDTSVAPFNNPDVRTALKLTLDRDDIIRKVYVGEATAGNDNPVSPTVKYAIDPSPKHSYDPEKAKALLKKAGFETLNVDLSVSESGFPGATDAATLYKESAAKAGININIIREPDDGYWENVWRVKPFAAVDWYGRATCDWLFTLVYAEGAAWNDTKWANPRFNELLALGRTETDEAKRATIYGEMQQLIHDDGGAIVVALPNYVSARAKRLANPAVIGGIFPQDNLRITERWWLA